jgi:hypothetical protein
VGASGDAQSAPVRGRPAGRRAVSGATAAVAVSPVAERDRLRRDCAPARARRSASTRPQRLRDRPQKRLGRHPRYRVLGAGAAVDAWGAVAAPAHARHAGRPATPQARSHPRPRRSPRPARRLHLPAHRRTPPATAVRTPDAPAADRPQSARSPCQTDGLRRPRRLRADAGAPSRRRPRLSGTGAAHANIERGEFPVDAWDIPIERGEFPIDAVDIPVERGEFPIDAVDIPVERGEFPIDAVDIPVERG